MTTSREVGYRHLEGIALRLLGETFTRHDPVAANEHLEAALQTLLEVGAQNEVAKTLVAQAGSSSRGPTMRKRNSSSNEHSRCSNASGRWTGHDASGRRWPSWVAGGDGWLSCQGTIGVCARSWRVTSKGSTTST